MKVLLLLRHADSEEKVQGQVDKDRSLTKQGIKQSLAVAAFLKEKDLRPDQVFASDAVRVRYTLDTMISLADIATPSYLETLYEADMTGYLDVVRSALNCQTLLIAGHNPGISAFASFICKTGIAGISTGSLLVFHFKDDSWSTMNKGQCELLEHFAPEP